MLRISLTPLALAAMLLVGGCTTILPKLIPSHNQSVDTSAIPSGRYELVPGHAAVHFRVDHMGYSTYIARFDEVDAAFEFDNARPEQSRLRVTIAAGSVDTNSTRMDDLLRGPDFLHAKRFPEILLEADGITIVDDRNGTLDGALSFHGVTRQVAFQVIFHGGARNFLTRKYTLGFSASATLRRSDFGMRAYIPLVGDEVSVEIEAEFQIQK